MEDDHIATKVEHTHERCSIERAGARGASSHTTQRDRRGAMTMTATSRERPAAATPSARLREATVAEHSAAETKTFIADLIEGRLTLADYTRYLAQIAYVYEALENRPPRPEEPEFLHDPRLARFAAARHDLTELGVQDWRAEHPALAATRRYVEHLRTVAADEDMVSYLAQHYTRYLGDLSGGQVIATMISRHYGATEDQLTFYRFDQIDKLVGYKRAYREHIDHLGLDAAQIDQLIAESKRAYQLNADLFDELARTR
ncbi:biliverdin-producing heme oxygenase [Pseudoclavibacter sp. CFCC 11306]|nr:biliverdin-producing heme oxygenase [Pseudoclavibacter sp. CFCC 11306]